MFRQEREKSTPSTHDNGCSRIFKAGDFKCFSGRQKKNVLNIKNPRKRFNQKENYPLNVTLKTNSAQRKLPVFRSASPIKIFNYFHYFQKSKFVYSNVGVYVKRKYKAVKPKNRKSSNTRKHNNILGYRNGDIRENNNKEKKTVLMLNKERRMKYTTQPLIKLSEGRSQPYS